MKLYLSSYRLGSSSDELRKLVKTKKAAIIANALDFSTDLDRKNTTISRELTDIRNLGFEAEVLDLRNYFHKSDVLDNKLSQFGLFWVIGGNTFVLRKAMKLSGFDTWLLDQRKNKDLVYAGYSAGVCVLSPSLKGLEIVDDPNEKADGYDDSVIWKGLGIIDWAFAPHYRSDHPESAKVEEEVKYYDKNNILYRALKDGEVIISET